MVSQIYQTVRLNRDYFSFNTNLNQIFKDLLSLLDIEADFFYLIFVENYAVSINVTFRFSKDSLLKIQDLINGKVDSLTQPFIQPLPLISEILKHIPGIKMGLADQDLDKTAILALHNSLWRYSEINARLILPGAESLKEEKLLNCERHINECLKNLKIFPNLIKKYELIAADVISGEFLFDEPTCSRLFFEDLT